MNDQRTVKMRLKPRSREQAFRAIEGLKDSGQSAYLILTFDGIDAIRICHPHSMWYQNRKEITKPEQLEVKEYDIIA